jgi:NTP pyrophosphatase (non-canonical NTP hydrolase)
MDEMTKKIVAYVKARDWEQFHNPKDVAISLSLEAAEVLEHFQWKNPAEIEEHVKKNKADIADELADVFYWVLLMSHYLKIDINEAFERKMAKNEAKYPIDKAKGRHNKYVDYQD